MEDILFVA